MLKNALILVYILVVLAISAGARAEVFPNQALQETTADLHNYNYKSHAGQIVALADGSLILAMEDQQSFLKLDSQIDLTPFIGLNVLVSGIELEHQLAPRFDLENVDPLPGSSSSGSNAVTFFVFGINEVRN